MTTTLADIQSRIDDDLNLGGALNTQITTAINRAIQHYQKEPFWFKETSGTFSTISAQKAYGTADGIPTDIDRIKFVTVSINSSNLEVIERDIKWVITRNPVDAQGWPTYRAWFQNKIYFYLVPNQIWTVTVWYTKKYTDLVAGSDTNDWLTYANDLIEARARWWVASRLTKSMDTAAVAQQEEMDALATLREINEGYIAQMKILPSQF